jgi:hypothetical protein
MPKRLIDLSKIMRAMCTRVISSLKTFNERSLGNLAGRHHQSNQGKMRETGKQMNTTTIRQTDFLDKELFYISFRGREKS